MTDWEKLKVSELKEELKSRGIALTGLKLKQQFIDKLVEIESTEKESDDIDDDDEQKDAPQTEVDIMDVNATMTETQSLKQSSSLKEADLTNNASNEATDRKHAVEIRDIDNDPQSSNELEIAASNDPVEVQDPDTENVFIPEQDAEMQDSAVLRENETSSGGTDKDKNLSNADNALNEDDVRPSGTSDGQDIAQDSQNVEADLTADTSSKVPTPEVMEDQRKRKRRSGSPAPDAQEVQKKAKMNNGEAVVLRRESEALEAIKVATAEVQDGRVPNEPGEEPIRPMEASDDPDRTRVAIEVGGLPDASELHDQPSINELEMQNMEHEHSPEAEHHASPSIHPATASIYIRNFKRPLHIPTLRSHISSIARSSSNPDTDTIKLFHLDVIRTHAFVSFTSISAAARVRNSMHETRFPDEPMREPLWVDFVPDEKVQTWIDQETGSVGGGFGGGRSSGRKYEVIYENTHEGVEAVLRDASEVQGRPSLQQQRSSRVSQEHTESRRLGIEMRPDHSEHMTTSTRDGDRYHSSRPSQPQAQTQSALPKSDSGKGFKALDELFSSTTTKPKLYYKPVPQLVVDSRLEMIRDLTTGHNDTGRSGDEGMKRYTFEEYKGREEWVDKGPEFGFGRKGQERLEGFRGRGRGTGSYRGRGRGGDSWRGGR